MRLQLVFIYLFQLALQLHSIRHFSFVLPARYSSYRIIYKLLVLVLSRYTFNIQHNKHNTTHQKTNMIQSSSSSLLTQLFLLTALLHNPIPVNSILQPVPGYPDCYVLDPSLIGNNECNNYAPYNTPDCGSDGLDCITFNTAYPKCKALDTEKVGDGKCQNSAPYNTEECQFDGGDCTDFRIKYPDCFVEMTDFVGDGVCQDFEPYNTTACKNDGGDCDNKGKRDWGDRYVGIGVGAVLGVMFLFVLICHGCKRRHRRLNADPQDQQPKRFARYGNGSSGSGNGNGNGGSSYGLPVPEKRYTLKDAKKKRELELSNHGNETGTGTGTGTDPKKVDLSGASFGASVSSPSLTYSVFGNDSDDNDDDMNNDDNMDIEAKGDQGQGLPVGLGTSSISSAKNDTSEVSKRGYSNLAGSSVNSSSVSKRGYSNLARSSVNSSSANANDAESDSPAKIDSEVSGSTNSKLEAAFLSGGGGSVSSSSTSASDGEKEEDMDEDAIEEYIAETEIEVEKDEEEKEESDVDAFSLDDASDASSSVEKRFRAVSVDFSV